MSKLLPARTDLPLLLFSPARFARRYWAPLLVLLIGATLDAITTYRNVRDYTAAVEVHPVQRLVFELFDAELGVPIAKLLQLAFVLFVAAWWRPWCPWILAIVGVLYTLAAMSNHFLWL